ncbi:unnamed protein product [Timema podura]|uniref:Uncharacterized protein n=1 Tax=Timema podura TaxID=61482 RepID=A0ABN7PGK9_TIMPD|nr:unnamed protein product [Timema podura]
MKFMLVEGQL